MNGQLTGQVRGGAVDGETIDPFDAAATTVTDRRAGHEPAVVTEIRAGKRASDGGLPVGERVRVRLLSADPASGIRFQLLQDQS